MDVLLFWSKNIKAYSNTSISVKSKIIIYAKYKGYYIVTITGWVGICTWTDVVVQGRQVGVER
mgnify:CR=1 FL=1